MIIVIVWGKFLALKYDTRVSVAWSLWSRFLTPPGVCIIYTFFIHVQYCVLYVCITNTQNFDIMT